MWFIFIIFYFHAEAQSKEILIEIYFQVFLTYKKKYIEISDTVLKQIISAESHRLKISSTKFFIP